MSNLALVILCVLILAVFWVKSRRSFRGFEASAARAAKLMNKANSINSFDSFKRNAGGDVVEYDIMRNLKKSGNLSQAALTSALMPYESSYR